MAKVIVKEDDRKYHAYIKRLAEFESLHTRVGVLGSKAAEDHNGETNAELALQHELGLGVSRRSWLRDWIEPNRKVVQRHLRKALDKTSRGANAGVQLGRVGAWAVGQIQIRWARGIPPPNEQSTIDRKGSSTPLIDTGQLRASVTWVVKR